ncbi:hypothetical protein SOVF_120510 [Spinacia oleracea]|nr:hypothetical protein SOVF_120510 [Spinacia oleracea]
MFCWTLYRHYLPSKIRESIEYFSSRFTHKFANYFSPYLDITFNEYTGRFTRSEAYTAIQNYLSDKSSAKAKSMNADYIQDSKSLLLKLGDNEEIMDVYDGIQVWWSFKKEESSQPSFSFFPTTPEKRSYTLVFHGKYRKLILDKYLPYVLEEGESIAVQKRRRKLFTNNASGEEGMWDHIEFKHPARFEMLAMEESKKQMILDDLQWFKSAEKYYAQIGKPWKRGYLLYGPPGTGKSTLVAAMANLLDYDIYDLELTAVKDNNQLRRLLIETTCKSIILIEDIDCSLDLTGQRNKKKARDEENNDEKDPLKSKLVKDKVESEKKGSDVTLSGLLNFIDGIWSACGEERIIVFTTNYMDKLDPALVRPGRMDVHIELSYCRYDAFKVLAKNYLKLESHSLFQPIERLLKETNITPASVAENLMPRSLKTTTVEACLRNLVVLLEKPNQENKLKSEQETMLDSGVKSTVTSEESSKEETS